MVSRKVTATLSTAFLIVMLNLAIIAGYLNILYAQNAETAKLNMEVEKLRNQVVNLSTANIEISVEIQELEGEFPRNFIPAAPFPAIYDCLIITGSAKNTRNGTAYNAGLNVTVEDANGMLLVNMSVPLRAGFAYGTNQEIKKWMNSVGIGYGFTELSNLYSQQTSNIGIYIFHEGIAKNWIVTPTWRNSK